MILSLMMSPTPALRPNPVELPPIIAFVTEIPPQLDARSWALWSLDADAEVWARNGDEVRSFASITKVMTALVVVENTVPAERVTISENADATPIGFVGQPEVKVGDRWTVEDLLAFLMVKSGNDAAVALAEHVAGSEEAFVAMMNQRADQLGMTSTTFRNPNGLDESGHVSTARDLIRLGRASAGNDRLVALTRVKATTFRPVARPAFAVDNTNKLLGAFPGVYGLKTGDTINAGLTLLSYLDDGNRRLVGVVLGSRNHTSDTGELLAYGITVGGAGDHWLAPLAGTEHADSLPDWRQPRITAAPSLEVAPAPARGYTPVERDVIAGLSELLPAVFGGDGA